MYDESISKGHTYRDNICPPLSSLMVYFSIGLYGENLRTEQSVPIDTMLKVNKHLTEILYNN